MNPLATAIALCLLVPAVATAEPNPPRFALTLGAGLGFGAAHIDGGHPFATDGSLALGARAGSARTLASAFDSPTRCGPHGSDGNAAGQVLYQQTAVFEPELLVRSSSLRIAGPLGVAAIGGVGLGPVVVATFNSVSKHQQVELGQTWTVAASGFAGVELGIALLTGFVGLRATVNGSVDAALGPEVALGVSF
ncbi:hypothetical protein BH11MYX2_BH11MYX2_38330 [soil metagenome]